MRVIRGSCPVTRATAHYAAIGSQFIFGSLNAGMAILEGCVRF